MLRKFSCALLCFLLLLNLGMLNISENSEGDSPPPMTFNYGNGSLYINEDININGVTYYNDTIIDLTGFLYIENGGKLILYHSVLRLNVTNTEQHFRIHVKSGGEIQILDNSTITDSILDTDTGSGAKPDFRYEIQNDGNFICKNSLIEECGGSGRSSFNSYGMDSIITFENSTFTKSYYGMQILDSHYVTIKNSIFKDCYYYGIYLSYCYDALVENNEVHNISKYGISVYSPNNVRILGCNISDADSRGLSVNYGTKAYIENNTVTDCKSYGMYLYPYYANYVVKNNHVNHSSYGIYIYRPMDNLLYNNHINDTTYGIYTYYSERLTISYNKILNTDYYGLYLYYVKDTIVNNNFINKTNDIAIYYYGSYTYRKITLENNTCINVLRAFYANRGYYVTLKNNHFSGTVSEYSGIKISYSYYVRMEHNIVEKFGTGIELYYSSLNSYDITKIYGGVVRFSKNYDLVIGYRSYTHLYNVSLKPNRIYFMTSYYNPYVNIYYNVDVHVSDIKGSLGGARVTVRETSGIGLGDITKPTDRSGWARSISVLNMRKFYSSSKSYGPYNFSSNVSNTIAYADSNYTISKYKKIYISYGIDTYPTPPVNLRLEVDYDDIILKWECYVTDLEMYKIWRDKGSGWILIGIGIPSGPVDTLTYTDEDEANKLEEYRYKVHHVDQALQEEMNDEWVIFTDWVITNYKPIVSKEVVLNGSLIVEDGGYLNLRNTSVLMNGTHYYPGIKAIEVRDGGKLVIKDLDDNNETEEDNSFINSSKAAGFYNFYVEEGGHLEIYNSWIQNSSYFTDYGDTNLYINSDNCTIMNSTIVTTSIAVYLESSEDCKIDGNGIFKDSNDTYYQMGIYVYDSKRIEIANNTIDNASYSLIEISDSTDVNLKNNTLLIPYSDVFSSQKAISLFNSENVLIDNNTFDGPCVGVQLSFNEDVNIKYNDFLNCTIKGIEAWDSTDLKIEHNYINIENMAGISAFGMEIYDSYGDFKINYNVIRGFPDLGQYPDAIYLNNFYNLQLVGNNISDASTGVNFRNWFPHSLLNVIIAYNTVHDLGGVDNNAFDLFDAHDMIFINNTIYNVKNGFFQRRSESILYDHNQLWNITYGYALISTSSAIIFNASFGILPLFPIYLNLSSHADIVDAKFNLSKLLVSDKTCEARIHWTINIRIKDHYGNYIPDIFLRIRTIFGTILHEKYTDPAGYIRNLIVQERTQYYAENMSFSPLSFEADYNNHTANTQVLIDSMQTIYMQLGNSAPNVYNIMLKPSLPKTTDDLILNRSYLFVDNENDKENDTYYRWYKNGVHVPALDNQTLVPSSLTSKGETWFCQVIPCDKLAHGDPGNSITVLIFNTKPSVSDIVMHPSSPDSLYDLNVNYTFYDIDGDEELGTQFHWYAKTDSDFEHRVSTILPTLNCSYTNEGEEWKVVIEPKDGEHSGDLYESSNTIRIGNTIPEVFEIYAKPEEPSSSENLTVEYTYTDIDGDPEGNTSFKWYKDTGIGLGFTEAGINQKEVPSKFLTKGEVWKCKVTPHDGSVFGTPIYSTSVTIGNTAPVISNLLIHPTLPETTDNLTITYEFYDRDSDSENDSQFEWFKLENNQLIKTGLKVKTLTSIFTSKGESWVVQVKPFDGFSFGDTVTSSSVTINNHAPTAAKLKISPSKPKTTDNLTLSYQFKDDDGDSEGSSIIKWYKNGQHISEFDNNLQVPKEITKKDEQWYFTLIPSDGSSTGITYTSSIVTIENTPPTIISAEIKPTTPFTNNNLTIDFDFNDPDEDSIKSKEILWFLNGKNQKHYQNEDSIPSSATTKGQSWKYYIRITDGEDYSNELESATIVIKNSPPVITEFNPGYTDITINEMESLTLSIQVEDNDNDLFIIQWLENGLIKDDDLNYYFDSDYNSAGNHTIKVTVQDWGTGSVMVEQEWNVKVVNVNRAPILIPKKPVDPKPSLKHIEDLDFEVSYYDDDTEDVPIITWFVDGEAEAEQTGQSKFTYDPSKYEHTKGVYTVKVQVEDSEISTSYSWEVTVKKAKFYETEYMGLNWDQWSIVLEALVLGATGILAFIGFLRFRKKKGALQVYMREIEDVMKTWKDDPDEAEIKLHGLSETIETDFAEGKIEDFHYFLLDRQIKESLREIRQTKIKRGFTSLPDNLKRELNVMLEDGRITDKEYKTFVSTITKSDGITSTDKEQLRKLMRSWKDVDASEGRKKVVIKPISVSKKKKQVKFAASDLGWQDVKKAEAEEQDDEEMDYPGDEMEMDERVEDWSGDDESDEDEERTEVWE